MAGSAGPDREKCVECGSNRLVCPDCGGEAVPMSNISLKVPSDANELVKHAEDGLKMAYRHDCTECDWTEWVTVTVERHGDEPPTGVTGAPEVDE